jgi:hypothetical protein
MTTLTVRLADPASLLPMPGQPGVFAPAGPFTVSAVDMFWAQCLADGSVMIAPPETPKPTSGDRAATTKGA